MELRAELADVSESFDASRLAIVDCVAAQSGADVVAGELNVSASSPADLTGIGMGLTDVLQRLGDRGVERVRLFFDSLSTLLKYADFERVYRFCHVLVQRIEAMGGLGFVTVDSEAVPETEAESLRGLFDEWRTREVYGAIAARGVDVHLYGAPDNEEPLGDQFVVHGDNGEEIADSWFVLFEGGGGQRRGLVCQEQDDRRYTGFWTFDGDVVESAVDYLGRAY